MLLPPLLGPLIPAVYALTRESSRTIAIVVLAAIALVAIAIVAFALTAPAPPSGIYEVDADGEPLEYLGTRPPLELRKNRGVTYEAFRATVEVLRGRS